MTTFLEETMKIFGEKFSKEEDGVRAYMKYDPENIKDFIASRLILQRKEIVEQIGKQLLEVMLNNVRTSDVSKIFQEIKEVLNNLKLK